MKGYKVFNPDWTCRGFQYEVGQTYKHDGDIGVCKSGFHFCRKAADCFQYYSFDPNNKVAEVEALGLVESDDTKSVTNELRIVREIPWSELLELVNTGDWNTGSRNTISGILKRCCRILRTLRNSEQSRKCLHDNVRFSSRSYDT